MAEENTVPKSETPTIETLIAVKAKFDLIATRLTAISSMVFNLQENRRRADFVAAPDLMRFNNGGVFGLEHHRHGYGQYTSAPSGGFNNGPVFGVESKETILARAITDEELDVLVAKSADLLRDFDNLAKKHQA